MKRWIWFEGMGAVTRRRVNTRFPEEFSKLKEIKGKSMHRYELHVYALA